MPQSSQGSRNSKNGKSMENRCAKMWTQWTNIEFRRRKVEGHDKNTVSVDGVGDIICANPEKQCKFTIESKNRKGFSFTSVPFSIKSPFWDWFSQSVCDSLIKHHYSNIEYYPFLHFKNGSVGNMVALYKNDLDKLKLVDQIVGYEIKTNFEDKISRRACLTTKYVEFEIPTEGVIISTWQNFIKAVDPNSVFY
jgi:hypothetical protein